MPKSIFWRARSLGLLMEARMRARSCFVVGRVWPARQGRLAGPAPSEALLESSPAVRRAQVYKLNPRQHDDIARHAVGTTPQQQRHLAACTCSQKPEVGACARAGNRCMLLFPHPRNAPLLLLKFDSSVASFCLLGEQGERARVRLAPPSSRGSSSEDRCVRSTCSIGAAGMLEGTQLQRAGSAGRIKKWNAKSVFAPFFGGPLKKTGNSNVSPAGDRTEVAATGIGHARSWRAMTVP